MTETQTPVQSAAQSGAETAPPIRLVGPEGAPVWGLSGTERLARMARDRGADARMWREDDEEAATAEGRVALIRRDAVIGTSLLDAFLRCDTGILLDEDGAGAVAAMAPSGRAAEMALFLESGRWLPAPAALPLPALRPRDMTPGYDETLRKRRVRPLARLVDSENCSRTEWALYAAADTGVTDVVTKYIWHYPAFHLAQGARRLGIPATALTLCGIALALLAAVLFAAGAFGWGLLAAWAMALVDTADGKLARVTVTTGRVGAMLDDVADLTPPPLWAAAWLAGLAATGAMAGPWVWIAALAIGGYIADTALEAAFRARTGLDRDLWRPFDAWFRLASAGRNTGLILLTLFALAQFPYGSVASVAIWTGLTLGVHLVRFVQAETMARGGALRSWMAPAENTDR